MTTYNFKGKSPALEPGSTILVTGVTGLIGGHVADQLLKAGYKVRGTTRTASKAQWALDLFEKKYGKGLFTVVEIPNPDKPDAYAEALKEISGVAHVASDVSFNPDPNLIIPPTVEKVKAILAAAAATRSVKRFVLTSSSTAMTEPNPNHKKDITTSTWNEESEEKAWAPPPYNPDRGPVVYAASKKVGEEEAWKYVKENNPSFVFNTILPNANFGPVLDAAQNKSTAGWIYSIYETGSVGRILSFPPQWFVHVVDTARLHVAALIDPDIQNERIIAFAEPYNVSRLLTAFRRVFPAKTFPDDIPNEPQDLMSVANERGAEILQNFGLRGWTSLEDSIKQAFSA